MKRAITSKWMWYSAEYQWVQRTHVQSSGVSSCTAPARTGGWVPLPGVDRWYEDTVQTAGLSQSEARSEDSWPIAAGDGVRLVAPGRGQCPVFTGHSSPLSPCQQATLPSSQPLTRTREQRQTVTSEADRVWSQWQWPEQSQESGWWYHSSGTSAAPAPPSM